MLGLNESEDMRCLNSTMVGNRDIESKKISDKTQIDNTTIQRSFTILPNLDHMDKLHEDVIAIWLDDTIGTSAGSLWFNIVGQLRQIISHVEVFTTIKECIDYVCSTGLEQIFLIVAGTYGNDFDKKHFEEIIHDVFIYVAISDKFEYNGDHSGIRGCFDNTNTLLNQIHDDYLVSTANTPADINFTAANKNGSIIRSINPRLIQWKCLQLTMDILRRMPSPREQSKHRLLQFCASYYSDNSFELRKLDEFNLDYCSDHAIRWYTRDCFLFRLLNKIMRTNNIDAIMDFSFVLTDIYDQLHTLGYQQYAQTSSSIVVYRGQLMDIHELKRLQLNVGGFISNNTMLSTHIDRHLAEMFSGDGTISHYPSVIFEISINLTSPIAKPFADVSTLSSIPYELEVLFTNGHIFRIDSCELQTNNFWVIQLTLCNDSSPIFENSSDYFDVAVLQLLEILPKISPDIKKANDHLLQWWRLYCKDDPVEQAKVDQFEQNYRSDAAIRWYTKDSLLYRLLNTALRQDNIDMIIDFRYFIIDLYEQLTKAHLDYVRSFKGESLTVYRGQKISLWELRRLKHDIGNYMSIKSLFSTSLSNQVALLYAESNESDRKQFLQSVLFRIDIDMKRLAQSCKNHAFANIANMSCIVDEEEVLFMINTQFKIQSVKNRNGTLWVVRLTLVNEDDINNHEIKIMNRYLNSLTNLAIQHYGDNIRPLFLKNNCLK